TQQLAGWPRYPGINELPSLWVKALVMSGKANDSNEWRLDSERSIRGGMAYMKLLIDRWSSQENMSHIQSLYEDPQIEQTKLVLASYNSGYTRVYTAFHRYGAQWITAPDLKEARRYVNRIFSLCDRFSELEAYHENET